MITLSRRFLRQFTRLWGPALSGPDRSRCGRACPVVLVQGSREGLVVQARGDSAAVSALIPGAFCPESLLVPWDLVEAYQAREDEPVYLESGPNGRVAADWREEGSVRRAEGRAPSSASVERLPCPDRWTANPPGLLRGLSEAFEVAGEPSTRWAFDLVELQGEAGAMIATDGRALLRQAGFGFPWTADRFLRRSPLLPWRRLRISGPVQVGVEEPWLVLGVGPWAVYLTLDDPQGRFPPCQQYLPHPATAQAGCRLGAADAAFLAKALALLPGDKEPHRPISLELGRRLVVRGESSWPAGARDLFFSAVRPWGLAVSLRTDRRYLARALGLGLREFLFFARPALVLAQGRATAYAWATLGSPPVTTTSSDGVPGGFPAAPPVSAPAVAAGHTVGSDVSSE